MKNEVANATSSRSRTLLYGAKRGAKLGAITALVIMGALGMVGIAIMLSRPNDRAEVFGSFYGFASAVAGLVGGLALAMIYGAIAGAFIMGIVATVRPKTERKSSEN